MKKAFCLTSLMVLALTVSSARADTNFTVQPIVVLEAKKNPDPSIGGTFLHTFGDSRFGLDGFWWVMTDWAEFHAGPTYSPMKGLTLGLDVGAEQDGHGNFIGSYGTGFSFAPNRVYAVSGVLDVNANGFRGDTSGIWYDLLATVTPSACPRLTVGVRDRRLIGIGPHVQLNVPEAHAKIWVLWAATDPERTDLLPFSSGLVGLTLGF